MTFVLTRIKVDDYDLWKQMFDSDPPGARKAAKGYRLFRTVDDPNEVTISVEFASPEDASTARERAAGLRRPRARDGQEPAHDRRGSGDPRLLLSTSAPRVARLRAATRLVAS